MTWYRILCLSLLVSFLAACSDYDDDDNYDSGGADVVGDSNAFRDYLLSEMDRQDIPALAALVFRGDQIVYEDYLGKSNIDADLDLAADHVFLLASISKVVTATALLQLYEQNRFDLDEPVNDYLDFTVQPPGTSTAITFRMLLTHTSGIADGSAMDNHYYYGEDSPIALGTFLQGYLVPGGADYNSRENFHDFEPGTDHEYSNIGSALIAHLVERISGTEFNSYCKQNIFRPLGMNSTFWRLSEINQTIVTPYEGDEAIEHYTFTDYPNGGLRTTARDLFTFAKAFTQGGRTNDHQLLERTTIEQMLTLQIPSLDNTMGLHLFRFDANENIWGHDGGEKGTSTIMGFNPDTQIGVILLANESDANLDAALLRGYNAGK
ncbi:MAG: beta-lactamase family protein [Bernardetiaceae bacterium]|nr:beta-lactamase family protein [Bernardetiaceae bacterium]